MNYSNLLNPMSFKDIFEPKENEIDIIFEKKLKEYIDFIHEMREKKALDKLQNMKYTILKERLPSILENLANNN